jgi:hypothetical protein
MTACRTAVSVGRIRLGITLAAILVLGVLSLRDAHAQGAEPITVSVSLSAFYRTLSICEACPTRVLARSSLEHPGAFQR